MPKKGQQGTTTPRGMLAKRIVRTPGRKLSPARTAAMIAAREKQAQALEFRKAGMTYREIADALGYKSISGAEAAVKTAIERLGMEAAKDVVMLDLVRLDEFQKRCTAELRSTGDLSQIDRIMRIMTMRHNLLGITAESYREAMAKQTGTSITNNGVMIVQGTESDYVAGMMRTVGVDPESPEAKKKLRAIEAASKKGAVGEALPNPADRELKNLDDVPLPTRTVEYQDEIIEAEIVNE